MKHISKLATHSPKAIIEDALGLTAIFVMLMAVSYTHLTLPTICSV